MDGVNGSLGRTITPAQTTATSAGTEFAHLQARQPAHAPKTAQNLHYLHRAVEMASAKGLRTASPAPEIVPYLGDAPSFVAAVAPNLGKAAAMQSAESTAQLA